MYWLPYSSHTSHNPSRTPCLSWISYATQKLMHDSCKMVLKQSKTFHTFLWHFFKFKTEFYCISFFFTSKLQFWKSPAVQSGFSRVYSNCYVSCLFEPEIIKIGQSSHKVYSNNILNIQESTTILNAGTKKSLETYWMHHVKAVIWEKVKRCTGGGRRIVKAAPYLPLSAGGVEYADCTSSEE